MTDTKTDHQEVLEKLVCNDIPDTRKLQEIRIESLGQISSYEELMQEHYAEKWENPSRLVRIPEEELERVYMATIPLTFPLCDFCGYKSAETFFSRWTSWDFQKGAMHLTTEEGLNRLLKIFIENNIMIQSETAYGKVFDIERQERPGVSVPHSWYVDTFDPDQCLFRHQFVVCEQQVTGIPYYFKEESIVTEKEQKEDRDKDSFRYKEKKTKETGFFCRAMFSSPDHQGDAVPKKYLPRMLEERRKQRTMNWDETRQGKLVYSKTELLGIGNPTLIYDPDWVKSN